MEVNCGFSDTSTSSGSTLLTTLGPTLSVDIGFDANFDPKSIPIPAIKDVKGLVDSGATESCIDTLLATELGLPIVDKRTLAGIGGHHEANMYLAQIRVPGLNFTIYGAFAGVNLAAGGQQHKVLVGRTFLRNFKMVYDGKTGSVIISRDVPQPIITPPIVTK